MKILFSIIIDNSKQLLLNTKQFWGEKKEQLDSPYKLMTSHLLPLLALVVVAVFFGELFKISPFYLSTALLKSARVIILFLLQYFLAVFFTNELIKTFGGTKNRVISQNLVAYSLTPFLVVSIVTGVIPFLYVLGIFGFYSFYIFWVGANELLTFPENKKSSYIIITIVVNFFVFSFLSVLLSQLLNAFY
jgi:hypothetical protein